MLATSTLCDRGVDTLQFSAAGDRLLVLVAYTAAYIVTTRGSSLVITQLAGSAASGAVLSSDGKTIATTEHEGRIVLWDADSGKRLRTLQAADDRRHLACPVFSVDGKRLFLASNFEYGRSYGIDVWDTAGDIHVARLSSHSGAVAPIVTSRDGSLLASGEAGDPGIRVWDTETLESLAFLGEPDAEIDHIALSSDGTLLAAGSGSSDRVWVWRLKRKTSSGHPGNACLTPPTLPADR
jgi:WD40 repeat protein